MGTCAEPGLFGLGLVHLFRPPLEDSVTCSALLHGPQQFVGTPRDGLGQESVPLVEVV